MKPKIVAIIPIRKNSQRVKNKNFKNFHKGKSLLEIKVKQLKKVSEIDKIVISSDSLKAEKIAKKYKVFFHKREKYFASSNCSGSDFFHNLATSINGEYLMYCPCTSPIIKFQTYKSFIKKFLNSKNKFDSLNSVSPLNTFIWKGNKSLNYNSLKAPNSQNLPKNYFELSFGLNLISRNKMIKLRNIVGNKPKFMILDKIESTDIDDEVDFFLAQALYKKIFGQKKQ
jgi:N-acylneuraminate cytidylyltransferase